MSFPSKSELILLFLAVILADVFIRIWISNAPASAASAGIPIDYTRVASSLVPTGGSAS